MQKSAGERVALLTTVRLTNFMGLAVFITPQEQRLPRIPLRDKRQQV